MVRPEKTNKYFPVVGSIAEEDETAGNKELTEDIVEVTTELSEDKDVDPDDAKKASSQPGWENKDQDEDLNNNELGIGFTLKKIDYICRRIASSSQKQAEWKLWASKLGYEGRGVIGGYGIQWNIAYDSRQRAYKGRKVIKQLLDNEFESCIGKPAKKNFFRSYDLTTNEWEDINKLNGVLKDFLELTKRMEGDGPKLPMVIYEYLRVIDSLEKKKGAAILTALEPMFTPMLTVTKKYLDLALACNTVWNSDRCWAVGSYWKGELRCALPSRWSGKEMRN
ncbi:hypothetical protein PTTG_08959 [Puccinia triticina 1-1 BBBD Race 1]|uniref:Uncharacterized protein n=1 Tax=Puccinia triticina (isolate 1-1 / race 1 (BBBD)) TaxID=630390 RepID=A0A180G2L0_PUCT1|nr:hypothetical protein PTTG_08959 [Puccinia triticina 1-1 BBBD Race 1]